MSPGGRPPIGPAINMRFPEDQLARIDELAELEGISRAEMIRRLIDEAVATRDAATPKKRKR